MLMIRAVIPVMIIPTPMKWLSFKLIVGRSEFDKVDKIVRFDTSIRA